MDFQILQALASISDGIYAAADCSQFFKAISIGIQTLGFDRVQFAYRSKAEQGVLWEEDLSSFPDSFLRSYRTLRWIDVDALSAQDSQTDKALVCDSFENMNPDIRKRDFVDDLRPLELYTGLVVPKRHEDHTISALAVLSLRSREISPSIRLAMTIITDAILAKAETLGLSFETYADGASALRRLSQAQIEILKWMAEGKSNTDIATITGYSGRSVRHNVSEILRKLGVATRLQAVAIFRNSSKRTRSRIS